MRLPPLSIPRPASFWGAVVVLLSAAVATASLLVTSGLPNTADGALHLFRALEVQWAWQQGTLYPRWAPHFVYGLGYPIFNYVPPLPTYLTAALAHLGLDAQDALSLVAAGAVALGGLGVYLLARRFLSPPAAAIAGAAYTLAPYRLFELYIQGNYPQLLATAVAPFCLWGLARLSSRADRVSVLVLALSAAALALTHNISVVMVTPLLVFYGLWRLRSPRNPHLVPLALAVLGGVLLSAFFWLPALGERDYVQTWLLTQDFFDFRRHFLGLEDLLAFPRVLDFRASNPHFPMSLGGHLVLLAIPSLAYLGRTSERMGQGRSSNGAVVAPQNGTRARGHTIFMWAALLGYVWLMLPASEEVWARLPLMPYIEFPHRLLGAASLPLALLVGASVEAWSGATPLVRRATLSVALAVVLLGAAPYVFPRKPFIDWSGVEAEDVVQFEAQTRALGTTSAGEYLPQWVLERPALQSATSLHQSVTVLEQGPHQARMQVAVEAPGPLALPVLYFPGWQAHVAGTPVPVAPHEGDGLLEVSLPSGGTHEVVLEMQGTPLQRRAWWVSLAGLGVVGVGLLPARRRGSLMEKEPAPSASADARRLRFTAGALTLLLAGEVTLVEPHTMLFREQSPPGTVLQAQHTLEVTFAGRIALLGYSLERNLPPQGEPLDLTLYWQPLGRLTEDYHVFVHLVSLTDGQVVVRSEKAAPGDMPSSAWHPALYVEDRHRLELPEHLPAVRYALRVGLYDPRSQTALPGPGGQMSTLLQEVQVVYNEPLDIRRFPGNDWYSFGEQIDLLGYRLDRTHLRPGEAAQLSLYWRAEGPVRDRLKRFVHLVNDSGTIVAQWDEWPVGGAYPTDFWLPKHNIADRLAVMVPASATPGDYGLVVGLYDATSLIRPEVRLRGSEPVPDNSVRLPPSIRVSE